ncbi:MAG: flagellar basal body L-ring protein FlgH [Hydrogenophaga sp.]|uniref:flagellar basal body L-ring protein FlgH n=1 Tax=Hydrogenophaga sp. TaxID=1904254 RepID=UPI002623B0AF|nr:flagellar basal body L-ring protein FlgH [Hydrogenophaga sp.]MDM7941018.1 flagellar basal body L-ring protein FlgH [Hydrogenophaga sp.]
MRTRPVFLSAWLLLAVLASGCETMSSKVDLEPVQPVRYAQAVPPAAVNAVPSGSLFQAASYRPAFEDPRARRPGDTLTVQITERLNASQTSSASIDRSGDISGSVSGFPFLKAPLLDKLTLGAQSENSFAGDGRNLNNNNFSGSITTTVQEVLPNGHLVVVGEKQIGVNQNVDVLRFSGTVDPKLIQPGNTVASTQMANVRVESRGRGAQGEAMAIGWLARFFLSVIPF